MTNKEKIIVDDMFGLYANEIIKIKKKKKKKKKIIHYLVLGYKK